MNRYLVLLSAIVAPLVLAGSALAYHGGPGGHLPPRQSNIDLVSKLQLTGAQPDRFADVAVLGNHAYVGRWGFTTNPATGLLVPNCPGGVTVVNISNPAAPREVASTTAPVGTYQTEGVQAIHLDTPAFTGDILVVSNERCAATPPPGSAGGISIYDVTNPASPQPLVIGFGDREGTAPIAHEAHSSFAWDAGDRAFVSVVDNAEINQMGIDIVEITDPRNPRILAESGIANWPGAQDAQATGMGADRRPYHHDSIVRQVGNRWIMLVNYWDAGHVLLDVTDPANPVFMEDSTYPNPDPFINQVPEGNAHQGEWGQCPESTALPLRGGCSSPRWIVGTDEDFNPFRLRVRLTSGAFLNEELPMVNASATPPITDTRTMTGPTYFVGLACTASPPPAAPSANAIAVAERGVCTFQEKLNTITAAGYQGGIVMNSAAPGNCETFVTMLASGTIPFVFVNRSGGYKVLGIAGYNPANCPTGANPPLPAPGTRGSDVNAAAVFDGWTGGVRLLDATTLEERDYFIIPEAIDRRFTDQNFGVLSVHEVATDPTHPVGYIAWYSAGAIVLDWSRGQLVQTGQYIDEGGMDVWGTQFHMLRDGRRYFVQSDRNYGLFVFRYGTDLGVRSRASANRRGLVRWTIQVRNAGTISSSNTVARTTLPRGVRLVSSTASQGRCSGRRTLVCNLGRMVDGNTAQIRIAARATRSGLMRATTTVGSPQVDYDPRNNRARSAARARVPAGGVAGTGAGGALTGRPR
jgi:uncharacterized repeat protein (TIGR01451 family)